MTPKDVTLNLLNQAIAYRDRAIEAFQSGYHAPGANLLGGLATHVIVPYGMKGFARGAGRTVKRASKLNLESQWMQVGRDMVRNCENSFKTMSILTKNLPSEGNSHKLLVKLNQARRARSSVVLLQRVVDVLEGVSGYDLIWNSDIPGELHRRKTEESRIRKEKQALKKAAPSIVNKTRILNLYNSVDLDDIYMRLPAIEQQIKGALDRFSVGGPDSERQSLISCRSALEGACIQVGGNGNWKASLKLAQLSETDQRAVTAVVNYIGGKIHGGHSVSHDEAEYGLKLTISTLQMIAKKSTINSIRTQDSGE